MNMAMNLGGTPILLLKEGTQRAEGRDAQRNNIAAAKVIAEAVRTSLGPKGMDKGLCCCEAQAVTNAR